MAIFSDQQLQNGGIVVPMPDPAANPAAPAQAAPPDATGVDTSGFGANPTMRQAMLRSGASVLGGPRTLQEDAPEPNFGSEVMHTANQYPPDGTPGSWARSLVASAQQTLAGKIQHAVAPIGDISTAPTRQMSPAGGFIEGLAETTANRGDRMQKEREYADKQKQQAFENQLRTNEYDDLHAKNLVDIAHLQKQMSNEDEEIQDRHVAQNRAFTADFGKYHRLVKSGVSLDDINANSGAGQEYDLNKNMGLQTGWTTQQVGGKDVRVPTFSVYEREGQKIPVTPEMKVADLAKYGFPFKEGDKIDAEALQSELTKAQSAQIAAETIEKATDEFKTGHLTAQDKIDKADDLATVSTYFNNNANRTIKTPEGSLAVGTAPDDVQQKINAAAAQSNVPAALATAVANQESRFNPNAKSPKGAIGMFQLMPATAKQLGVDPTNPDQNIAGGVRYLGDLMTYYNGDQSKALAAYNAGPGAVDAAVKNYGDDWVQFLPEETKNYVDKITGGTSANGANLEDPIATLQTLSTHVGTDGKPAPEAQAAQRLLIRYDPKELETYRKDVADEAIKRLQIQATVTKNNAAKAQQEKFKGDPNLVDAPVDPVTHLNMSYLQSLPKESQPMVLSAAQGRLNPQSLSYLIGRPNGSDFVGAWAAVDPGVNFTKATEFNRLWDDFNLAKGGTGGMMQNGAAALVHLKDLYDHTTTWGYLSGGSDVANQRKIDLDNLATTIGAFNNNGNAAHKDEVDKIREHLEQSFHITSPFGVSAAQAAIKEQANAIWEKIEIARDRWAAGQPKPDRPFPMPGNDPAANAAHDYIMSDGKINTPDNPAQPKTQGQTSQAPQFVRPPNVPADAIPMPTKSGRYVWATPGNKQTYGYAQ